MFYTLQKKKIIIMALFLHQQMMIFFKITHPPHRGRWREGGILGLKNWTQGGPFLGATCREKKEKEEKTDIKVSFSLAIVSKVLF